MDIKQLVADKLVSAGEKVKNSVIDSLYNDALKVRTDACLKLISLIDAKEKSLKELKVHDNNTYDEDGKVVSGGYSKSRVDAIKKASGELNELTSALQKALEENDFTKVLKIT